MGFAKTGVLVPPMLARLGLTPERAAIQAAWERAFETWGAHVEVLRFQEGELLLGVTSPVHFQEVMLRRTEIAQRLNDAVGTPAIRRVSVRRQA